MVLSKVNGVKFNEYSSVVVSAGYDQINHCALGTADPTARSRFRNRKLVNVQIIDTFADSVISVCLTKTEIIGGSVDGTVRTFDMRIGREISDSFGQPVSCISMSASWPVTSVSYHPKDNCMITSSGDGAIWLWKA
ncbi:WD repeat domain-containing protein [Trifolium repens]|nr:WD repeat domain-containing protein [Trifolium repens]